MENTKAQMRKGILELCILSIIAEGGVSFRYHTEVEGLRAHRGGRTLYPLLTRLKNAGLLTYNWKESTSGPPRKYFSLTNDGTEFLNSLMGTWNTLVSAVSQTTKNINSK
ncbi:MAG: PadR family transcriptional regulator [Saprospiraceae bacterium]